MISPVLPTYARAKVAFERGEGVRVFTPEGEAYLDFGAGVAVTSSAQRSFSACIMAAMRSSASPSAPIPSKVPPTGT